ncbi:MAG TPA: transposase [Burkholderiales bacterium]|nr:transposase [Burkholderiales bacterium]
MPRRARLRIAGAPLHIIQRGNNRGACFFADQDYGRYLQHLEELALRYACAIHAHVLMSNHVHLLLTPGRPEGASPLMKHLGQRYVQYVNRVYGRSGTLWEGRFRSSIVQAEAYLLRCQRYIELNPVRAGMVDSPGAYRWSSFGANALGRRDTLITPHPVFRALGLDDSSRRAAYLELFRSELASGELEEIRVSTNAGYALGSERFRKEIAAALGRRAGPGRSGRPVETFKRQGGEGLF